MLIRPLTADDVEPSTEVILTALPFAADEHRRAWVTARTERLLRTDPGGSFVAVDGDELIGVAGAICRDGIWGLSMLAVQPERHAQGAGRRLVEATLTYGAGEARGGLICSSEDPRAMRLYARAGFDLRPCVSAAGIVDRASLPGGLRSRPSDDLEHAAEIGRRVRGGAYATDDLQMVLDRPGLGMLAIDGRGFAIHHPNGSTNVLCATDEEAARDLLLSCFAAGTPGASLQVDFITAEQQWAVRAALDCRLPLTANGPLFTRGELGPLRPFLPSGALL